MLASLLGGYRCEGVLGVQSARVSPLPPESTFADGIPADLRSGRIRADSFVAESVVHHST